MTGLDAPQPTISPSERRTTPIELLWDLVFAFAITQVATLLTDTLTWPGFARAMLVLALVWWAWSAFVWAANAQIENESALQLVLLPASGCIFIAGLALPHAYTSNGLLFVSTYAVVRLLHLGLYTDASRRGNASWSAIAGFGTTVLIGMALLVIGALVPSPAREWLWLAAVAIDYAGPAWLTRERLHSLQRMAVAHFAERYGLFIIICLGESIVSVGTAAVGAQPGSIRPLSAGNVVDVGLCLLITIGLWWAYFEESAEVAERHLREHPDPVLAAADGYSYLHLPIVGGIIIFAVGGRLLAHTSASAALPTAPRLALCAGVTIFLLGHLAFLRRLGEGKGPWRLGGAGALLILFALGGGVPAWVLTALVAVILGVVCAAETRAARAMPVT